MERVAGERMEAEEPMSMYTVNNKDSLWRRMRAIDMEMRWRG